MHPLRKLKKAVACFLSFWIGLYPVHGAAEDIDIFVGSSAGSTDNPNVLIVLDNTSNWSRQSQQWPGGEQQGQSEVDAIKTVVSTLNDQMNVGLMEFVTDGNANDNGGYIRYAIRAMNSSNKTALGDKLTTIYGNVTSPTEKRNSGTAYGNLMRDVYNYYAGAAQSQSGSGTPSSLADADGYTSTYSQFRSPISCGSSCAKSFIILVSNPDASGPSHDDSPYTPNNTSTLSALGGNTSQIALANYTTSSVPVETDNLGYSSACYAAQNNCSTSDYSATCASYDSCTCNAPTTTTLATCSSGQRYVVQGITNTVSGGSSSTNTSSSSASTTANNATACYASQSLCSAAATAGTETGGLGCGINTTTTSTSGNTTTVTQKTYSCTWSCSTTGSGAGCQGSGKVYDVTRSQTTTTTTTTTTGGSTTTGYTDLGLASACSSSAATCSTADYASQCNSYNGGCRCVASGNTLSSTTGGSCTSGARYSVWGNYNQITPVATGTSSIDTAPYNADEWSRFLYQNGVPVSGCNNQKVVSYTIDVYNKQPNATHTSLMQSMARVGGGKYFSATNKTALVNALKQIFVEIQSVNSTFASASLPINATNRAQNENQVFIGMFRPDPDAKPRWFGNVKRYQLIQSGSAIELGDANGQAAINNNTGFITDCATSWWTTDSSTYWQNYPINPTPAGACTTTAYSAYSDSPDGPRVEKGAVAEVIRKGNDPTGAATYAENRTVYTASGTTLQTFNTSNTGLSSTLVNWARGQDTEDEDADGNVTETRASLHGDVVHSRPLPVNYCTTSGCSNTVVYYGANDGSFRAVEAETGKEKWAFIAPEFNGNLDRLRTQSPLINYPSISASITPTPAARSYAFDGSIGIYQTATNDKVWIYPTMRRGGRTVYALDVTTPASPGIKWKFGCPNLTNDTGCSTGATAIGQTWSIPNVAFIKGFSTSTPVVVMGGGYDSCEDADSNAPSCASTKGNVVYVLNANTGAVLATLSTLRAVVADVALIDIDFDGYVDYAYVADTGGNLYRINFASYDSATGTYATLSSGSWTITRIAYTSGGGRKFLFAPALFGARGVVYTALGSGDREHPLQTHYPYTAPVSNRFYMYRECLPSPSPSSSSLTGGDNLDDTTLMNGATATSPASCTGTQALANNCATNKGWFMTLNNGTGEQTVTSAVIAGGMVTFSTNRPIPAAAGTCSTALGEARGYWLDLYRGSGAIGTSNNATCGGSTSSAFVGGGLPPSPVIGTVTINGVPQTVVIGAVQRDGSASSPISPQKASATNLPARKRVYSYTKGDH